MLYGVCVCVCLAGAASSEQKGSTAPLSLGEQAASLRDAQERLQALRRVTSTAQILLAYSMVMRTLSQSTARSDTLPYLTLSIPTHIPHPQYTNTYSTFVTLFF